MDKLQRVFDYQGATVRTVVVDGDPWFVAKDVCEVLGIANHRDATSRLSSVMKGDVGISDTIGRIQNMTIVSEPGLYKLLFRSTKPEAEKFANWVASDVLPAIRKTGAYVAVETPTQALLQTVQLLATQEQKLLKLEQEMTATKHRVDNLDAVNIKGDKQQRLNAMIRKYALDNGLAFSVAWRHFVQAFNTSYRTNLQLLKTNYPKKVSTPQYLAAADRLDDALRVADKMLNISEGA